MKVVIPFYNEIRKVVSIFSQQLKIDKLTNKTGRKLALTVYGDLDLSLIDQMPSGRKKIETKIIMPDDRAGAYEFIR